MVVFGFINSFPAKPRNAVQVELRWRARTCPPHRNAVTAERTRPPSLPKSRPDPSTNSPPDRSPDISSDPFTDSLYLSLSLSDPAATGFRTPQIVIGLGISAFRPEISTHRHFVLTTILLCHFPRRRMALAASFAVVRPERERKRWRQEQPVDFTARPVKGQNGEPNLFRWECCIPGHADTLWPGCHFPL
jgi:hypothetical protein